MAVEFVVSRSDCQKVISVVKGSGEQMEAVALVGEVVGQVVHRPGSVVTVDIMLTTLLSTSHTHLAFTVIDVVWLYVGMVVDQVDPSRLYSTVEPTGQVVAMKVPPEGSV